jgi:hypothetical protein
LPTPYDFEKRSIRCGIYPEQVEYVKEGNKTLEGEYYITVYGYTQSTFSLVFFTHTSQEKNEAGVKLTLGMKQKGVLKSTNESAVFFFKLSNDIREDVEVRLQSENGQFTMLHALEYIPSLSNFTDRGNERQAIRIRQT